MRLVAFFLNSMLCQMAWAQLVTVHPELQNCLSVQVVREEISRDRHGVHARGDYVLTKNNCGKELQEYYCHVYHHDFYDQYQKEHAPLCSSGRVVPLLVPQGVNKYEQHFTTSDLSFYFSSFSACKNHVYANKEGEWECGKKRIK